MKERIRQEGWAEGRVEGWAHGRDEGWALGRDEDWARGRDEDWAKGRDEGWTEAVARMAGRKFGAATAEQVSDLLAVGADRQQTASVVDALSESDSPEDFLARVRRMVLSR